MKITSLFYHNSDHEDTRLCANKAHMLHLTSQTQVQPNTFLKLEQDPDTGKSYQNHITVLLYSDHQVTQLYLQVPQ